jgi:hypothetical protein
MARPKLHPAHRKVRDLLPAKDIFDDDELKLYGEYVEVYLADFDADELISSDLDDIMSLSMNKVLSFRLLKETKGDSDKQLDMAATIEKLDKRNEKLKENLSSRRRDRINPNELKGFSIVDLAVAYDQQAKAAQAKRMAKLRAEEKLMRKNRESYDGNRLDIEETKGEED